MFLDFGLSNPHVNHVGDQFYGSLNGTCIQVGFVRNCPLEPEVLKTSCKVVDLSFEAGCIDVREGEQLVNAGSHHYQIARGRL